jgi:hypothetical protein
MTRCPVVADVEPAVTIDLGDPSADLGVAQEPDAALLD